MRRRPGILVLTLSLALAGLPSVSARAADDIVIPDDAAPYVVDEPGRENDRIVVTRVPGVEWYVGDRVVFPEGASTVSIPVPLSDPGTDPLWVWIAGERVWAKGVNGATVRSPGALTDMEGHPEWWLRAFRGRGQAAADAGVDVTPYPRTLPAGGTTLSLSPFAGARGGVWGWMQFRTVHTDQDGRRTGPWVNVPTFPSVRAGQPVPFRGRGGATYEFRAKAADLEDRTEDSQVTSWSEPVHFAAPSDASGGQVEGDMRQVRQPGALGGAVMRSTARGGSWTSPPFHGTEMALAFSTSARGSHAEVLVDGRKVATVHTHSASPRQRQVRYLLRDLDPGRAHRVTIVNAPRTADRTLLDIDAMVITSTRG